MPKEDFDEEYPARIVKCVIEMEYFEGEHFNIKGLEINDERARTMAALSFLADVRNMSDDDLFQYVQTRIIEEVS